MIDGYDQWKTASPYDNEIDWGEMGVKCPECGCDAPEDQGNDGIHVELWCPDCGHRFKVPLENDGCEFVKDGVRKKDFLDEDGLTT